MSVWEPLFSSWSSSPGQAEQERCDNAIRVIMGAIDRDDILKSRSIKTFVQGSYRNRVNISKNSDVDIGVICNDVFIGDYPEGESRESFGINPGNYSFYEFKDDLERALINRFGAQSVSRGKKAFSVKSNSYRVDADVVPLLEHRQFWRRDSYRAGVCLFDEGTGRRIDNYPEKLFSYWPETPLHYENGVNKNGATGRSFKGVVRILKNLRARMEDAGSDQANIPSYLIECLVFNAPNSVFARPSWFDRTVATLSHLDHALLKTNLDAFFEVDRIKYLFHAAQPWSQKQAREFVKAAQARLQMRP